MKQTAVEWLYDRLTSTWFDKASSTDILKKSKEIEKKQIIEAYLAGDCQNLTAEEYYKETYK